MSFKKINVIQKIHEFVPESGRGVDGWGGGKGGGGGGRGMPGPPPGGRRGTGVKRGGGGMVGAGGCCGLTSLLPANEKKICSLFREYRSVMKIGILHGKAR